jgi:hypothetical protein
MTSKRTVSAVLVASLMVGFAPVTAWAAGDDSIVPSASVAPKFAARFDLRAATASALAGTVIERQQVASVALPPAPKVARRNAAKGGGGGGMGITMAAIGIAASLGATYFVMKEVNKSTEDALAATKTQRYVR